MENRSLDWFVLGFVSMSSKHVSNAETSLLLVDFSYHPQIHDWGWISFHLKEENASDIVLETVKNF